MLSKKKYLYLPLEITIRELDSKVILAHFAASSGWTVVLAPKVQLYSNLNTLPKGVFFVKSAVPSELEQIKNLRSAGHRVCSLDEEGVVTYPIFLEDNHRYNEETVQELDLVFFWGQEQAESFNKNLPMYRDKGKITGSPRYEFWQSYAEEVYKDETKKIRKKYSSFILLPSSFGIANNYLGLSQGLSLSLDLSECSKELEDFLIGQWEYILVNYKEFLDFLPKLAGKFPHLNFVFRPHPSEDHRSWNELAEKYTNLHVEYSGSVTPWILASTGVMHFCSTTSLEAYLMGIPAINYHSKLPEYMDQFLLEIPNEVSFVSSSRQGTIENIKKAVAGNLKEKPHPKILDKWIYSSENHSQSKAIIQELDTIAITSTDEILPPKQNKKRKLYDKIKRALSKLDKTSFLYKFLPNRLRYNPKQFSYGLHKAQGFDFDHIQHILHTVSAKNSSPKVMARKLTNDFYILEHNDD